MSNTLATDVVRPVEGFTRPSHDVDIEKRGDGVVHAHETNSDTETKSIESDNFQNGVQRVRAITEIWSKETLIIMFILYVADVQNETLVLIGLACISSNSLPSCRMPSMRRSTPSSPRPLGHTDC